jgi:hypothetical protein
MSHPKICHPRLACSLWSQNACQNHTCISQICPYLCWLQKIACQLVGHPSCYWQDPSDCSSVGLHLDPTSTPLCQLRHHVRWFKNSNLQILAKV